MQRAPGGELVELIAMFPGIPCVGWDLCSSLLALITSMARLRASCLRWWLLSEQMLSTYM